MFLITSYASRRMRVRVPPFRLPVRSCLNRKLKPIALWQHVSRSKSGSSQERLYGLRFAVNEITEREVMFGL